MGHTAESGKLRAMTDEFGPKGGKKHQKLKLTIPANLNIFE